MRQPKIMNKNWRFPFSSSRVLSLSGYILSLLSMIAGSNVVWLAYLYLHLYPRMTNPTDRCFFPYLANFMVQTLLLLVSWYTSFTQNFCDLQFHHGLLELVSFTLAWFTNVSKYLSMHSIPTNFLSFLLYISYARTSDNCTLVWNSWHLALRNIQIDYRVLTLSPLPFYILCIQMFWAI